jgi:hypothetical protein
MPKLDFQTIRMHMQGARWLLPRAGYVVYALFGFGQLMINWLLILGRMLVRPAATRTITHLITGSKIEYV